VAGRGDYQHHKRNGTVKTWCSRGGGTKPFRGGGFLGFQHLFAGPRTGRCDGEFGMSGSIRPGSNFSSRWGGNQFRPARHSAVCSGLRSGMGQGGTIWPRGLSTIPRPGLKHGAVGGFFPFEVEPNGRECWGRSTVRGRWRYRGRGSFKPDIDWAGRSGNTNTSSRCSGWGKVTNTGAGRVVRRPLAARPG